MWHRDLWWTRATKPSGACPGPHSPRHGIGHAEAAVPGLLERCNERVQKGPVCLPVCAASQAEDDPLPLELQGRVGGQTPDSRRTPLTRHPGWASPVTLAEASGYPGTGRMG